MTTTPSFHRFMDGVFGTAWRRSLTATRIRRIHRDWWRGKFNGRSWDDLRAELLAS